MTKSVEFTKVSDLKKRVKPGLVFYCENHAVPKLSGDRTITAVNTKGFSYTRPNHADEMFLAFPKKKDVTFAGDTITFWRETPDGRQCRFILRFTEQKGGKKK